ncbi:UbiX family flavin prenyltransferase [Amycolatopsis sp. CA-230715]|uniref:UbiX family flavin prenyltransferase n=1 Tax=Amycolatopsis sp. CA-230715 TaxID=2745196 RepID=UPI001C00BF37|nr:UbiX family flavin prenyltransferase [Amycolatopsis sp. CA-230715]QWF84053.1 putative UbiX-like flavin prenyltransferase [Amycolatopsis sp. CA-230715]
MKLIVGITGASGAVLGVRVLEALRELGVETHLVLSKWGRATVEFETDCTVAQVRAMADYSYAPGDQCAAIASGSFRTDGMVIVPCSMKTLAAVRMGYGDDLITRAADVALKERRRLVVVPRELPFSEIHLENMLALTRMGAVIAPPVPVFYTRPATVDDVVTQLTARVLDQFGLDLPQAQRWTGLPDQRLRPVASAR